MMQLTPDLIWEKFIVAMLRVDTRPAGLGVTTI